MKKSPISPEPGKRIRALREKLGLTRVQFDKETGVNASTLRAIEVGECQLSVGRATTISHMFVLLYEMDPAEASVDAIFNGPKKQQEDNESTQ